MAFKKGHDPRRNLAGRPKGSVNKDPEEIRKKLRSFLDSKIKELPGIYRELGSEVARAGAKEKVNMLNMIMRHVLPPPMHDLQKLTDEDLDKMIEKLKNDNLRVV